MGRPRKNPLSEGTQVDELSQDDIDTMAIATANSFATGIKRVSASIDDDVLTLHITTIHGTASGTALVEDMTAEGVQSALDAIKAEMIGS